MFMHLSDAKDWTYKERVENCLNNFNLYIIVEAEVKDEMHGDSLFGISFKRLLTFLTFKYVHC